MSLFSLAIKVFRRNFGKVSGQTLLLRMFALPKHLLHVRFCCYPISLRVEDKVVKRECLIQSPFQ